MTVDEAIRYVERALDTVVCNGPTRRILDESMRVIRELATQPKKTDA